MTSDPVRPPTAHHHRPRWYRLAARPGAILIAVAACLLTAWPAPAQTTRPAGRAALAGRAAPASAVATSAQGAPGAREPQIIPKPASMTAGRGRFTLTPATRIVANDRSARAVAADLAGYLRPATGYRLPVLTGRPRSGDITLMLGRQAGPLTGRPGEAYTLDATPGAVRLAAATAHGLYDAVQTFRQLLPPWIASPVRRPGPWSVPAVRIADHPRYAYRGLMLDIARHYEPPAAVKRLISQAAAYKIDVLHLHMGDDQGFRLVINGFPRLARIGGRGSVGTHGRVRDPGGYWTQAQYRSVVAYAAAHFIAVVPEIDSPGHTNAIIMSEYNDTKNPRLHHPHNINCGAHNPPVWNYTEDVGYSALCPGSKNTWTIVRSIVGQLSRLSPGPFYDIGGDEVPSSLLSQARYASFVSHEARIVRADHKTLMGWADIAGPGTRVPRGSVAEYWEPASGSSSGTVTAREAVKKGMRIVMAPANHAYLDQKYRGGSRGDEPPGLGQTWACPHGCDLKAAYNWDPGSFVTGVTDRNVIGVEGAVWTETLVDLSTVDYMTFPRLLALAELGWSPSTRRIGGSPADRSFFSRVALQGGRLMAAGVNFYPSTQVRWRVQATGSTLTAGRTGRVSGTVATVAAPGFRPGQIKVTVSWGDGRTSRPGVSGRAPTGIRLNSLYTVHGMHRYAHPGVYHGHVRIQAPHRSPVTVPFTVTAR